MIGIDLTRISRFINATPELVAHILHPKELDAYTNAPNQAAFLAARWAIKEALFKADNTLKPHSSVLIKRHEQVYAFDNYDITTSAEEDFYIAYVSKRGNNES